ncbi:hypothetical protein Tcan_10608 [Toxocara canis]|uniref:Uncharacterized protein n=1 Tax=Toxocara canis TaxID=6265 RepID=A0A0B2UPQ3_TOXCA|nr:hypothetical protein Tcan_10608 [Toxocara canis]
MAWKTRTGDPPSDLKSEATQTRVVKLGTYNASRWRKTRTGNPPSDLKSEATQTKVVKLGMYNASRWGKTRTGDSPSGLKSEATQTRVVKLGTYNASRWRKTRTGNPHSDLKSEATQTKVVKLDGGEKAERIWADKDGEKDKHFERSQRENEKLETNEKVKNGNNNEIRRCGRLEGKVARCIETHKRVEKVTEEKETKQEIEESIKLIGKPLSERKKDTWIKANPRAQPIPPKSESKEEIHDERPNRATQSESASDPIPEPLSDARTQQSRTVIIQSDDDTTKHVESLKESMSD